MRMQAWIYAITYLRGDGREYVIELEAVDETSALDIAADYLSLEGIPGRPVSARRTDQKGTVFEDWPDESATPEG